MTLAAEQKLAFKAYREMMDEALTRVREVEGALSEKRHSLRGGTSFKPVLAKDRTELHMVLNALNDAVRAIDGMTY